MATTVAQQTIHRGGPSTPVAASPSPSSSLPPQISSSGIPQPHPNNAVGSDPNYATFFEEFWSSSWPQLSQGLPSPPVALLDYKDYYSPPPSSPGAQQQQQTPQQQQQQQQHLHLHQQNAISIYNQLPSSPSSPSSSTSALGALIVPTAQQANTFSQQQNTLQFQLNLNFPNSHSLNSPPPLSGIPTSLSSPFQTSSFSAVPSKEKKGENGKGGGKSRKKTSRACVYCQRSHSCCDVYRPCSKCTQRGIGHLCRDGEPKTTKRKEYLYLLADNTNGNEAMTSSSPPSSSSSSFSSSSSSSPPHIYSKRQKMSVVEEDMVPQHTICTGETCSDLAIISNYQEIGSTNLNFAQIFGSRKRRPFPKDIRVSFHRLAERCGHWTDHLISMWGKVEEFWCSRDSTETPQARKESGFRRQVNIRANAVMQLLNDLSEPMLIWSEGLRIYAVNKAAQAFFGRTADEMTNAKLGYDDDEENEEQEWHPEQDLETRDHAFRLFDLIHPDDATAFGCSAAADAIFSFPVESTSETVGDLQRCRGFRMKVRANLTKQQANRANVVPTVIHTNSSSSSSSTTCDESVTCVVTQSHFRDSKGRFMFASCTFVRIDDL